MQCALLSASWPLLGLQQWLCQPGSERGCPRWSGFTSIWLAMANSNSGNRYHHLVRSVTCSIRMCVNELLELTQ